MRAAEGGQRGLGKAQLVEEIDVKVGEQSLLSRRQARAGRLDVCSVLEPALQRAEHRGGGVHVIREAGFDLGRSYAQLMSHARTNQDD